MELFNGITLFTAKYIKNRARCASNTSNRADSDSVFLHFWLYFRIFDDFALYDFTQYLPIVFRIYPHHSDFGLVVYCLFWLF